VFTGDKFGLGPLMTTGVMLLGHSTWQMFAERWPSRTGEFPDAMNAMAKAVVSRRAPTLDAWNNSSLLEGDLIEGTKALAADRDVVVVGSISVVHQLTAADAVDEYRLLTVPVSVGTGTRLFEGRVSLDLVAVESIGTTVLARYQRGGDHTSTR
jgi:dihydrofolate reductase